MATAIFSGDSQTAIHSLPLANYANTVLAITEKQTWIPITAFF
jgi:hypothetical protein